MCFSSEHRASEQQDPQPALFSGIVFYEAPYLFVEVQSLTSVPSTRPLRSCMSARPAHQDDRVNPVSVLFDPVSCSVPLVSVLAPSVVCGDVPFGTPPLVPLPRFTLRALICLVHSPSLRSALFDSPRGSTLVQCFSTMRLLLCCRRASVV